MDMQLNAKNVLVVGLGVSGFAAANLLLQKGARVSVTDASDSLIVAKSAEVLSGLGAKLEIGKHTEDFVKGKDIVVVSPGVNPKSEVIGWANQYQIPVISELDLAFSCIDFPVIGVTGTNGKSTVTVLINHILKCAGKKSVACGNLGVPLSDIVFIGDNPEFAVIEVSSFQLYFSKLFRPYISVWLNFSCDHLDYHKTMDEYLSSKLRIFQNQTENDWAVVHYKEQERPQGLKAKKIFYGQKSATDAENFQAASAVAKILGIDKDIVRKAVDCFTPLPHRMEYVDGQSRIDGIKFINDSKATNVHAVIHALNNVPDKTVLILGGRDKGDDFTRLNRLMKDKVSCVVVFGEAKEKIISQMDGSIPVREADSLKDAVGKAFDNAVSGSSILFSPGCSSFDMFKNYEERGREYRNIVRGLHRDLVRERFSLNEQ